MSILALLFACSDYELAPQPTPVSEPSPPTASIAGAACTEFGSDFGPVEVDPRCGAVGELDPVVSWQMFQDGGWDLGPPAVGALSDDDGDGMVSTADPADVVVCLDERLRAFEGASGEALWEADVLCNSWSAPAIGDVDGDGWPEVAVVDVDDSLITSDGPGVDNYTAQVTVLDGSDGSIVWRGSDPSGINGEWDHWNLALAIRDLDGDGRPEVIAGPEVFDGQTGALESWGICGNGGLGEGYDTRRLPALGDLDGDGRVDMVGGNAAHDWAGRCMWSTGGLDGYPSVADMDGDGAPELVAVSAARITLVESDGVEVWSMTADRFGPATLADVDGDDQPEILVSRYDGELRVLGADGTTRWMQADAKSAATVFDFDGDGSAEVVYSTSQGVIFRDGSTGTQVAFVEGVAYPVTSTLAPVVADLDADGRAEVLVTTGSSGLAAIEDCHDTWMPAPSDWSHQAWDPAPDTFRAQPLVSASDLGAVDAVLSVPGSCPVVCDGAEHVLEFQLGNAGTETFGGDLTVQLESLGSGDQWVAIDSLVVVTPLESGAATTHQFRVPASLVPEGRLRLQLQSNATQCSPDEDSVVVEVPACS